MIINSKIHLFKNNKKALSPVIATVLLVGISVSTFVLLYFWSQDEINNLTGNVKIKLDNQFEKTKAQTTLQIQGNKAIVFNEGLNDLTNIAVYVGNTIVPCYRIDSNTSFENLTWTDNFNDSTKTDIQTNTTINNGKASLDITFPPNFQSDTSLSDYFDPTSTVTAIHSDNSYVYVAEYSASSGTVLNIYDKTNLASGATPILNASVEITDQIQDIYSDSNYIYVAGQDDEILVYNKFDKNLTTSIIATEPNSNQIDAIVTDGNFIYSGTNAYAVITITDNDWNRVREMNFWGGGVNSLFVDTKYVYAGLQDGRVIVINKSNWQKTADIKTGTMQVTSVKSDVSRLYVATENNFIYIYEKDTWDLIPPSPINNS